MISSSAFTERMSRKLQRAGLNEWVGQASGDKWGKYILFRVGGRAISGAGWTQRECEEIVNQRILNRGE